MANEYFITIINETPLPINIETWRCISFGLSEMKNITLKKGERKILSSETGEWFVNTYFNDKFMCEEWDNAGYTPGKIIGKFSSEPAIRGENVWMVEDDFKIVCFNGIAKFSKK